MRFACDAMLGKLARYLRILGFDAMYLRNADLLDLQEREDDPPYFLTRRRKAVAYERTIYLKTENVRQQLEELRGLIKPFVDPDKVLARCINCNLPLVAADKDAIEHRVPEFVFHTYNTFKTCPQCQRVYWAGTHTEHMAQLIEEVTR
jgi:uncharacterized protein with PIN domain